MVVHNNEAWKQTGVCWIGGARYSFPLDSTQDEKWRALNELGVKLFVVGFSTGLRPHRFTQHARFYLLPRVRISLLRYLTLLFFAPLIVLWIVIRYGARTIVTQSPYEGAAGALVKNVAGLFGVRIVLIVESHTDFQVTVFMQRRVRLAGLYRWLMGRAAAYALNQADALRVVSSSTRAQIEAAAPGKPVEQFMAWTDARVFAGVERSSPPSQSHDILYSGVLIPRKGVHFLLAAFARLVSHRPDARLWLVGAPENRDYSQQLIQQARELAIDERVEFVGVVSQSELATTMARARVMVLPSLSEALGRVVVEAMLCGTPVIGSQTGGIPDMVQEGVNGFLVPPGDVDALAECLCRVFRDDDVDRLGQQARVFAGDFFSIERYVDNYRRLFEQAWAMHLLSSVEDEDVS
jgi:glycosyltransferase involved in cell wall biosynthesis